jgi:hypothetical protein
MLEITARTDTLGVESAVLVEAAVLDRDLGLSHDRRDLGERHDHAVLVVGGGDQRAVTGQDPRLLGQRGLAELAGQGVEDVDPLTGGGTYGTHGGQHQAGPEHSDYDRGRHHGREQADDVGEVRGASPHSAKR